MKQALLNPRMIPLIEGHGENPKRLYYISRKFTGTRNGCEVIRALIEAHM